MRLLTIILLSISLSALAACPNDLREVATKLEKEFLNSTSQIACDQKVTLPTAVEKEFACESILSIEDEIRKLEKEVAIMRGIEKLIDDIETQKNKLAEVSPKEAKVVAAELKEGLEIASRLEMLVSDSNPPEFVSKLVNAIKNKSPEEMEIQARFLDTLHEVCKIQPKPAPDFCEGVHNLPDHVYVEVRHLILENPSAQQIEDWREALAITTPEGDPYSFTAMEDALSGLNFEDSNLDLDRDVLMQLRRLPNFQNKAGLTALDKIKSAKDQLEMTKIFGEFNHLTKEILRRQSFETRSSLSIVLSDYKSEVPNPLAELDESCGAPETEGNLDKCLKGIEEKSPSLKPDGKKHRLLSFLENAKQGVTYSSALENFKSSCLNIETFNAAQKTGKLSKECLEKMPNYNIEEQLKRIEDLTRIKDKALEENNDLFVLRNAAMIKIKACQDTEVKSTIGEFCEIDLGLPKELDVLSSELNGISTVLSVWEEAPDLGSICDDEETDEKAKKSDLLIQACRVLKVSEVVKKDEPAPQPEAPKKTEEVEDYTPRNTMVRDAWVQGGINLAATIGQGLMQRPYNPYANFGGYQGPYYYSPGYNYGMGSTSDNLLMFNSAYFGSMSYYQSAPGYVPYSAYPIQGSYAHSLSQFFSPYTPLR